MNTNSSQSESARLWLLCRAFGLKSEVWMHRQASAMQRMDVTVCAYEYLNQDILPEEGFRFRKIEGRKKPTRYKVVTQAALWARAVQNYNYGGFRGTRIERDWWAEQIQSCAPDVVLAHFGTTATWFYPILNHYKIPIVAHFNGIDLSGNLSRMRYRRELKKQAKYYAGCVVVADYMRDRLLSLGVAEDRIFKIPYGAPMHDIVPAKDVGASPCRFVVVGRMTEKKRPDLTLQAFAMAAKVVPESELIMVGDGPLMDQCKALSMSLGLEKHVSFLGFQTPERVFQELQNASVFVQHSVTASSGDKEGWPVAIAEAAAHGLPVVSTRHASIPDQVEHETTGLLCDETDWRTMGEHMTTLASDPERRKRMGDAARTKMLAFDTKAQVEKLEQVLLRVAQPTES